MNERIRELAKQADIHFSKSGTLDAGPNGIAKFVLYADLEKFAELIVQDALRAEVDRLKKALAEQPAPVQEPAAWIVTTEMQDGTRRTFAMMGRLKDVIDCCDFGTPVPLYTTPQAQPADQFDIVKETY